MKQECYICGKKTEKGNYETIEINPTTDEIHEEWVCEDCLNEEEGGKDDN